MDRDMKKTRIFSSVSAVGMCEVSSSGLFSGFLAAIFPGVGGGYMKPYQI
jgi:hypothetical protein